MAKIKARPDMSGRVELTLLRVLGCLGTEFHPLMVAAGPLGVGGMRGTGRRTKLNLSRETLEAGDVAFVPTVGEARAEPRQQARDSFRRLNDLAHVPLPLNFLSGESTLLGAWGR